MWRLDTSWGRPDRQLCNRLSITRFMQYHIRATFERCCLRVRMVALLLHVNTIMRTASGWCCPDVRTVAILYHVLPYQGWCLGGIALSSRQMQLSSHICLREWNPISCRTLMSVQTDATLNCSKLLDTDGRPDAWLGHPDGSLESDFSDLESAHNLL